MTTTVLQAGDLNRRITLQARGSTRGSYGQQSNTWTDWATCWARIEPSDGREMVAAQAVNAETSHLVTIRYRAGVTAAMRVVFGARIFNVLSVIEPEMARVSLVLACSEGLNAG